MNQITSKEVFKFLSNILQILLIFLAFFLIYRGEVIKEYLTGKTLFAEKNDPLKEVPAVIFQIKTLNDTENQCQNCKTVGKDFWISFASGYNDLTKEANLTEGKNTPHDGVVQLLKSKWGYGIEIQNSYINQTYKFSIHSNEMIQLKTVEVALGSKQRLHCGPDSSKFDENSVVMSVKSGEHKHFSASFEKHQYNPNVELCRKEPYNDLLLIAISKNMGQKCTTICLPEDFEFCNPTLKKSLFPVNCESQEDKKCFSQALKEAEKSIVTKPCTNTKYKLPNTLQRSEPLNTKNKIIFELNLGNPPSVNVKQQKFLYNWASLIGKIGGIMSLFAGINILKFFNILLWLIEFGFEKSKKCFTHMKNSQGNKTEPLFLKRNSANQKTLNETKTDTLEMNHQDQTLVKSKDELLKNLRSRMERMEKEQNDTIARMKELQTQMQSH